MSLVVFSKELNIQLETLVKELKDLQNWDKIELSKFKKTVAINSMLEQNMKELETLKESLDEQEQKTDHLLKSQYHDDIPHVIPHSREWYAALRKKYPFVGEKEKQDILHAIEKKQKDIDELRVEDADDIKSLHNSFEHVEKIVRSVHASIGTLEQHLPNRLNNIKALISLVDSHLEKVRSKRVALDRALQAEEKELKEAGVKDHYKELWMLVEEAQQLVGEGEEAEISAELNLLQKELSELHEEEHSFSHHIDLVGKTYSLRISKKALKLISNEEHIYTQICAYIELMIKRALQLQDESYSEVPIPSASKIERAGNYFLFACERGGIVAYAVDDRLFKILEVWPAEKNESMLKAKEKMATGKYKEPSARYALTIIPV